MPYFPVAERELRVAARRPGTYRIRALAVLVAGIAFVWKLIDLADRQVSSAHHGRELFTLLSILAFIYCYIVGAQVTADCLSREKREGTLGLLFLTDLKGYDVVLGKLAASSLNAIYGLVAIVPMLAVSLMLGGVSIFQILSTAVALFCTLLLSLSAGMFVSSIQRNERKAFFFTFVLLFCMAVAPVLISFTTGVYWFATLSPLMQLNVVFRFGVPGQFIYMFWFSMLLNLFNSWLFLKFASNRLPRSWQDKTASVAPVAPSNPVEAVVRKSKTRDKSFRTMLLDENPFMWLSIQSREKIVHVWGFLVAMVLIWLMAAFQEDRLLLEPEYVLPWALFVNTFLKIWLCYEATQRLVQDRASGALELLLSTPLNWKRIIEGQWLALRKQFALPISALLLLEGFIILRMEGPHNSFWLVGILIFAVDFFAIGWASMWLALTSKGLNRSVMRTLGLILVLPWALYLGVGGGFEHFGSGRMSLSNKVVLWTGLSLLIDAVVIFAWAKPRLDQSHRIVEQQFQTKPTE